MLTLTPTGEDVPKPARGQVPAYIIDDVLHWPGRPPIRLAEIVNGGVSVGLNDPVVLPAPSGNAVLYHARRPLPHHFGMPLLRLYDLRAGRDVVFEELAASAAWRADGKLAYADPLTSVFRERSGRETDWLGHVYVRDGVDGPPARWTAKPSLYHVWAWAGDTLLAGAQKPATNMPIPYFGGPCGGSGDVTCENARRWREWTPPRRRLLALTGNETRELPLNGFIAVSPDGRLVAGIVENARRVAELVRVVDVESGRIVAQLDVTAWRVHKFVGLTAGSWAGASIATAVKAYGESRIVVLRLEKERLAVAHELAFEREALRRVDVPTWEYWDFGHPLFVGGEDELSFRIDASGPVSHFLTCDLTPRGCRIGRPRDGEQGFVLVQNPSRPLSTPAS